MKIYRPLWSEGTLLSPQQFQQQALWEAFTNESLAQLSHVYPWGVEVVEVDDGLLKTQRLQAQQLRVRLPDGTLIDTRISDVAPPARDLSVDIPADQDRITVLLALPLPLSGISNVRRDDVRSDRPLRFHQEWVTVTDAFGDEEESMAVARHDITLRFDFEENAEYQLCPVARLVRDGQGGWQRDSTFIPPLLAFSASQELVSQLDQILTQLQAKRRRLMAMRRESNQRMADFAVADVSLFWLLNALNTHVSVLAELKKQAKRHPEQVWFELSKLAGSLLTFSLEHDTDAIPGYDHEQPETVFPPLFALIAELLEASLPSRVIAVAMQRVNGQMWKAPLHDMRLREEADFYLSVRAAIPAHQLQTQFPALCKIGAPDDVNNIINVALAGIPLIAMNRVPAAIPVRLDNQYFALDMNGPAAHAMLASGVCMFYVPELLGEIELELFAVLRS
jgi:type VI secretion system protein ImpJ